MLGVVRMQAGVTSVILFPQQFRLGTGKHQTRTGWRSDQLKVARGEPFSKESIEPQDSLLYSGIGSRTRARACGRGRRRYGDVWLRSCPETRVCDRVC